MSSGHEVSGETLNGLSIDTRGDREEIHCWEREKQESQTHLREIMGDTGRSKLQGKKVRKHSRRSGEQNRVMEGRKAVDFQRGAILVWIRSLPADTAKRRGRKMREN